MPLDKKSLEELFRKLEPEVTTYMNRYDGGHDMNHIRVSIPRALLGALPKSAASVFTGTPISFSKESRPCIQILNMTIISSAMPRCSTMSAIRSTPLLVRTSALPLRLALTSHAPKTGEDVSSMVKTFMLSRVDEPNEEWEAFAAKVQIVSTYVSFSTEKKDPEKTKEAISQFPELAIVQVGLLIILTQHITDSRKGCG